MTSIFPPFHSMNSHAGFKGETDIYKYHFWFQKID